MLWYHRCEHIQKPKKKEEMQMEIHIFDDGKCYYLLYGFYFCFISYLINFWLAFANR